MLSHVLPRVDPEEHGVSCRESQGSAAVGERIVQRPPCACAQTLHPLEQEYNSPLPTSRVSHPVERISSRYELGSDLVLIIVRSILKRSTARTAWG